MEDIFDIIDTLGTDQQATKYEEMIEKFGGFEKAIKRGLESKKEAQWMLTAREARFEDAKNLIDESKKDIKRQEKFIDYIIKQKEGDTYYETKVKTDIGNISYRKSTTTEVDEEKISSEYKKSKVVESLDKVKIKEDIVAGKEVVGAYLKTNYNLQIK